jgi:CDP-paratose synthetase
LKETILLTGATGFLGSHLLESLISNDYNVIILKRSFSDIRRIKHLISKTKAYDVDLLQIESAFRENKIDCIIHTSCKYGRNGESIKQIVESNLIFGLEVLELALKYNTRTFVNTDSFLPREINAYSLSKNQFLDWLKHSSNSIQVINLKLEHIYGPGDDTSKFVAWLFSQLLEGVHEINLTSGEQKRDFIYITDVVSAYLIVIGRRKILNKFCEFQVGTGTSIEIKSLVLKLKNTYNRIKGVNKTKLNFGKIPYREGEIMNFVVNNYDLKQLGWNAETNLDNGLEKTLKQLI